MVHVGCHGCRVDTLTSRALSGLGNRSKLAIECLRILGRREFTVLLCNRLGRGDHGLQGSASIRLQLGISGLSAQFSDRLPQRAIRRRKSRAERERLGLRQGFRVELRNTAGKRIVALGLPLCLGNQRAKIIARTLKRLLNRTQLLGLRGHRIDCTLLLSNALNRITQTARKTVGIGAQNQIALHRFERRRELLRRLRQRSKISTRGVILGVKRGRQTLQGEMELQPCLNNLPIPLIGLARG